MRKELELHLVDMFPSFFRDYGGDPRQTCMSWGCTHGDGWLEILVSLCENIEEECEKDAEAKKNFKFSQIKEKFGTLRVYTRGGNKAIYDLILDAEKESAKVCEYCGIRDETIATKGTIGQFGWIRTLCQNCRAQQKPQKPNPRLETFSPLEMMIGKCPQGVTKE